MSKNSRYHVITNEISNGVLLLDSHTGAIQRPVCHQDLAAYYYYLVGRGKVNESQKLLAESMAGDKPITNMLMSVTGLPTCPSL
jgi:hypothetical protein